MPMKNILEKEKVDETPYGLPTTFYRLLKSKMIILEKTWSVQMYVDGGAPRLGGAHR